MQETALEFVSSSHPSMSAWLRSLEQCPDCARLADETLLSGARAQEILDRWIALGRPDMAWPVRKSGGV